MSNTMLVHSDAKQARPLDDGLGFGWGDVLRTCLRASWIILPVAMLGGAAAYGLATTMEPIYETDSTILLDRPNAGKLDNAADTLTVDPQQKAVLVHNQTEVIRGREVVRGVIRQLHLIDAPMFNPQPGLVAQLVGKLKAAAGLHPAQTPPPTPEAIEARVIREYLDHLTIRQDAETYILHVGFRGPDPALLERIVNTHVAGYIAWVRGQQSQAINGAQAWLGSALDTAHNRVLAAEAAVQELNRSGVLPNVEGRTALDEGLAQLTTDLAIAQASLVKSEARADEIRRMQRAGQDAGIASLAGSRVLEDLQAAYAQSVATSVGSQSNLGSRYPGMVQNQAHDSEIKAAIARETDHIIQGELSKANIARVTVTNLTAALERMKQQAVAAQGDRAKLARLEGEADAERTIYLGLLQKLRSYDKVGQLANADVTVLATAPLPDVPRAPQRTLFTIFGFLLGGGTAAGASVWRLSRRNVVRHTADAISLTGIRCLGIMPALRMKLRGGVDRQQLGYSFFREELRAICATLVREHAGKQPAGVSVMVTSSLPQEGKSTFCYELGLFAAQSGVRTLIVHADQPSAVHRRGAVEPSPVPLETDLPLFGVDWVAPATMLGGYSPERSLETLRQQFGLVIFDTPPLSAMAESVILAPLVDAVLVLAQVNHTPRSLLTGVTDQIERAGGHVAGLVLTFVRLDTQQGMMPSDPGYYFRENRSYHRRLTLARAAERA